jgi:hypothetical protein
LKFLRGTPFDVFGYTEERKTERALIGEYEQAVETLLTGLTRDNHALAVEIASLPESIRGYGHIKATSIAAARKKRDELLARFASGRDERAARRAARWGLALLLALCPSSAFSQSARPAAEKLLRHLAAGEIEAAAQLSNVPARRLEEFTRYRATVGEDEFKKVYASYFQPANPLVAEIAIGAHRLLIWRLGDAGNHLAGQFYVRDGRFRWIRSSETRSKLRQILEDHRTGKLKF